MQYARSHRLLGRVLVGLLAPAVVAAGLSWLTASPASATTVKVTYYDPKSGWTHEESVDPTSFTPATAASLAVRGLPASWSASGSTYNFATWTDGGCLTTNSPCTPLGNYYDPGVATTLTGDITLNAIYGPDVTVSLQCPVSGTTLTTFTVPRWSLTSAFPDPTNLTTASPAGCVGWDLRYYHVGTTWQGYQAFRGQEVVTGGRFRNTSTFAATFVPQYDLVPMRVYFRVNGGTGTMDQTALSPGDIRGDYQTGTFYPTQTTGVQWTWNLSKAGHYYSAANALPYWTIEGVTGSPKMCGNSRSNYPADCSSSVAFFHPDILSQSQWGSLTNATERSFTLVANYVPAWYVTYDANGGTGAPADSADAYPYGSSAATVYSQVTLSSTRPTRSGYTFLGWNTAADGSGRLYQPLSAVSNSTGGAKTLYAQWSQNYYTLRFSDSAGSSVPDNVQFAGNSTFTLPTQVPSRRGYSFAGWNTQSDGSGNTYAAGASYTGALSDAYLYAQWTPGTYTVTFDLNDADGGSTTATGRPSAATGATDSSIIISATPPTRVGYTFGGWTTQASGAGTTHAAGATFPLGADDHTLYAKWTAKTYTLTAYANAGTANEVWRSATVTFDTTVTPFSGYAAPNWNPAVFEGLNSAADGSGTSYPGTSARSGGTAASTDASFTINSALIPVSGSAISVYAQYAYPFTFYKGTTSTFGSGAVISSDQYASLNTPGYPDRPIVPSVTPTSVAGHSFVGWTTDASKSGTSWTAGDTAYSSGDLFTFPAGSTALSASGVREAQRLYAMYQANTYNVFFDTKGGSNVSALPFTSGGSITIPAAPTRAGYEFRAWSTDPSCASVVLWTAGAAACQYASKSVGSSWSPGVTRDTTLYAIWKFRQTLTLTDPADLTLSGVYNAETLSTTSAATWSDGVSSGSVTASSQPITYSASPSSVCRISGSSVEYLAWGTCTVTASQAGNGTYASAADVSQTVTVTGKLQTATLAKAPSGSPSSAPTTWIVTAGSREGTATSGPYDAWDANNYGLPVTFATSTPAVCSVSLTQESTGQFGGEARATVTKIARGSCVVTASQSGYDKDGNTSDFAPATSSAVTIAFKDSQSVTYTNAGVIPYRNVRDTFTLDVTKSSTGAATYSAIEVASSGTWSPTGFPFSASSQCSVSGTTVTVLGPGRCAINGSVQADSDYYAWSISSPADLGQYTLVQGFDVTLHANGGSVSPTTVLSANGARITLPTPTRSGYTFLNWKDSSNNTYAAGSQTWSRSSAETLTAQWQAVRFTVTYNTGTADSGSAPSDSTLYQSGDSATILGNTGSLTRSGYTFAGWNTAAEGSGTDYSAGATPSMTSSLDLYPKWTAESYSLSFNENGGSGSASAVSATFNQSVTLPGGGSFSRAGHTFSGWATSPSGGVVYSSGSVTWVTDAGANGATDILYAVWTPESYTVTLDPNGGAAGLGAATSISSTYGQSVSLPDSSDYTRDHYTLVGWGTARSGAAEYATGSVTWATDAGPNGASDTLYAVWTPDTYVVTLQESGGSTVADTAFDADGTVAEPTAPSKAGATFVGWSATSLGTTPLTFPYAPGVYVPITLYAIWGQGQSITFVDPGPRRLMDGNFTISATTSSLLDVMFSVSPSAQSVCALVTQASPEVTASTGAFASGATVTVKPLKKGTCTITATRAAATSGGVVYAAASDVPYAFSILGVPQAITFVTPPDETFNWGRTVTISPVVNADDSTSRDPVVASLTTSVCTPVGPSAGVWTIKFLSAGTCQLRASHTGDDTYSAATTVTRSFEIANDPFRDTGSEIVEVASGQALYLLENGTAIPTPVHVTNDGQGIIAGQGRLALAEGVDDSTGIIDMGLRAGESGAARVDPVTSKLIFVAGRLGQVSGTGFMPNSLVEIWIFSTPYFLGYAHVDGNGDFVELFTVPASLPEGDHTIQAEGLTYLDTYKAVSAGVQVEVPASPPGGGTIDCSAGPRLVITGSRPSPRSLIVTGRATCIPEGTIVYPWRRVVGKGVNMRDYTVGTGLRVLDGQLEFRWRRVIQQNRSIRFFFFAGGTRSNVLAFKPNGEPWTG